MFGQFVNGCPELHMAKKTLFLMSLSLHQFLETLS